MVVRRPSVEGIESIRVIREARSTVENLRQAAWDFKEFPQVYARDPAADVVAKEIVHIHDGVTMTRVGRLHMVGVGDTFNLMGPIPSDSVFWVGSDALVDTVNRRLGSRGLHEFDEFVDLGTAQRVDFFNYTLFYGMEDLIFWAAVHDAGVFPTGLEYVGRHFAAGNLVQNSLYRPAKPSHNRDRPALMVSTGLNLQFPTPVVEWMDKPIYGGLAPETMHVETLLTLDPSPASHPYLPLVDEGRFAIDETNYYFKRYVGKTPKEGMRGPGVPEEGVSI